MLTIITRRNIFLYSTFIMTRYNLICLIFTQCSSIGVPRLRAYTYTRLKSVVQEILTFAND